MESLEEDMDESQEKEVSFENPTQRIVRMEMGNAGRPRFIIDRDHVIEFLEMGQKLQFSLYLRSCKFVILPTLF
ncbi:unnamed protein product [Gadus morhua 'NCC']